MKEYYKEKLKIIFDLFKITVGVILVLIGGLAALLLKENFGDKSIEITLLILGCIAFLALLTLGIILLLLLLKDLKEFKNK